MTAVRLVAEVSSNHHRDRLRCLNFVHEAAKCGCAAVKFQQFRIDELFAPEALAYNSALRKRKAWELPEDYNAEIAAHARDRGIQFASTPFYLGAVAVLEPLVDFFKLASYQLLWLKMLREVARTEKPVVLSTGMATLDEVRAAVDALGEAGCNDLTLLHCVSTYPTPVAEANLAAIRTLRDEFQLPVGWSDHTVNVGTVVRAIRVYGAETVEFHFDLEGAGAEFAGGHCWLPMGVRELLVALADPTPLEANHPADGDGVKAPRFKEKEERDWRTDPSDGLRPLLATRRGLEPGGAT